MLSDVHHDRPHHHRSSSIDNLFKLNPHWKPQAKMVEFDAHCHKPNCDWILLGNLTSRITDVPPLNPNPELSGIGVILGFSITAYLTLALLVLHYVTVHEYHRTNGRGKEYSNPIDRGVITFIRQRVFAWSPTRRFVYAMEKAVLILSDAQLVTGLAILISGYSQLDCGISAYHWQIMVYLAWFSSFSFLSAMTFLEGYFMTNNPLRILRVFFMVVLASFLIVALLPTGSDNWLNMSGNGFYPSLPAQCYFKQIEKPTYNPYGGPKTWSMAISVLVVAFSYIHNGIRLFDPTAEFSRRWFRSFPGWYVKQILRMLEDRATAPGLRAATWSVPYLLVFAAFASARALYDIAESMLLEIIWLTFAMAWGTIKLWDTRSSAVFDPVGNDVGANEAVLEEDFWSFGQTLPLVLLLLPILSMVQTYLDNDAKAQDALVSAEKARQRSLREDPSFQQPEELTSVYIGGQSEKTLREERTSRSSAGPAPYSSVIDFAQPKIDTSLNAPLDPRNSTSCSIRRCNHHPSPISPIAFSSIDFSALSTEAGNCTSCSIRRCNHHPSVPVSPISPIEYSTTDFKPIPNDRSISTSASTRRRASIRTTSITLADLSPTTTNTSPSPSTPPSSSPPQSVPTSTSTSTSTSTISLPRYPYAPFTGQPWYTDHIILLIFQILWLVIFALYLLTLVSNFMGLSVFLRNRLFLTWGLAIIPAASLVHLAGWYGAGELARAVGVSGWLMGSGSGTESGSEAETATGSGVGGDWDGNGNVGGAQSGAQTQTQTRKPRQDQTLWIMVKEMSVGQWVCLCLRTLFVMGLLVGTFFISLEAAGPEPLQM
ncbi:hypothetical protein K491DRAFT_709756 [Lophiostoma macrostomum CBS 122681]|uniref:Uncharacterized protein n=1 Tax=Lophiostoma macrostomum CBS 122681 TaxID=1314788 RepID=A0A6A6TSF4_9PLEO|nr:hypothetical protein K491DRAFT_709756 [Lophiostoma macrostomum CBS 122681]